MTNLRLSLVAGYPVESPSPSEHIPLPSLRQLWKRITARIHAAQRRRQEADIADFIERNGGLITDDIERQIGRHFGI
jgi:hypothetical protein